MFSTSVPRSSGALSPFRTTRQSAVLGATQPTVPLHLLPHPRHLLATHQLRHQSTLSGRQICHNTRTVNHCVGPLVIPLNPYTSSNFTRNSRSAQKRNGVIQNRPGPASHHRTSTSRATSLVAKPSQQPSPIASPGSGSNTAQQRPSHLLTHLDQTGAAHMVEISDKHETKRVATAVSTLLFSNDQTFSSLSAEQNIKGNAIAVARLAAIQAAKKTADLIPLAHPSLGITGVSVNVDPFAPGEVQTLYRRSSNGNDDGGRETHTSELVSDKGGVTITATVKCFGRTGVEMEAITAATMGAVTMYDMLKAIDKGMVIMGTRVIRKEGGKSGGWTWDESENKLVRDSSGNVVRSSVQSPEVAGTGRKIDAAAAAAAAVPVTAEETMISGAAYPITTTNPLQSDTPSFPSESSKSEIDEWNQGLTEEFSIPGTDTGHKHGNRNRFG